MSIATLRVMTLNIWGLRGNWPARRDVIRKGLRELQPDLIALQEVVVNSEVDQLAELLPADFFRLHQRYPEPDGQGSAIGSRYPIVESEEIAGTTGNRVEGVGTSTMISLIDAPNPIGRVVFANHGTSWQSDRETEREIQAVHAAQELELWSAKARHTVLAGDMNGRPDSAAIRFFIGKQSLDGISVCYQDVWEVLHPDEEGFTFSPENPLRSAPWDTDAGRRIDYVLIRAGEGSPALKVGKSKLVFDTPADGVWASDHFGVFASFTLEAASSAPQPESGPSHTHSEATVAINPLQSL